VRSVLFPVDGSKPSLRAAEHLIERRARGRAGEELHVLNVQNPLPGDVRLFVSGDEVKRYHRDESAKALAAVRRLLDRKRVPYTVHMAVGDPAATIVRFAKRLKVDEIVMGTRGHGAMARMLLGSVAGKVLHDARIPVLLIK
jgi:nucleotide-binding universal stress UspA family protein